MKNNRYIKNIIPADLTSCNNAASFLQSGFWGSFKALFGWSVRAFSVDWGEGEVHPLLVLRRRLILGFSFAYIPWGPELPANFPSNDEERTIALLEIAKGLQNLLPHNTIFIRFDPPWYNEGAEVNSPSIYKPFTPAGADIQPPDTVLLDLKDSSLETLLSNMKSKCRYNIGLAKKKGVIVKEVGEEGLECFYSLLKETATRDGIAIHGFEYYKSLFSHCKTYTQSFQELSLYIAEHEGDVLASMVVLFRGKEAVYLYGASSNQKRNLMAPYLLQWKAIEDAKLKACEFYDFFGIPPREDPDHPMIGLYRFKTGFGGRIIHRAGSWDYSYYPILRDIFILAEKSRKKLRSLKKSRSRKLKKGSNNEKE